MVAQITPLFSLTLNLQEYAFNLSSGLFRHFDNAMRPVYLVPVDLASIQWSTFFCIQEDQPGGMMVLRCAAS